MTTGALCNHLQHTCHICDGHGRSLQFLQLGANADLVLAAGSEVIEALSGSPAPQTHLLLLTIWKIKTTHNLTTTEL